MGLFGKIGEGLRKTSQNFVNGFDGMLGSFHRIDDDMLEELEELLILADVGVETSAKITTSLKAKVKQKGAKSPADVKPLLAEVIEEMLGPDEGLDLSTTPAVVLVIGVNGVGKTTTIGKLACAIKEEGKTVLLGAADTFRAAAIEQLEIWAKRADAALIKHSEGADPAAVVFDSINAGKARGADVIICDTAGRLHNKKNLMDELQKISRIIEKEAPDCAKEVLLVIDATTGQNGVAQAKQFQEAAGITGIILTKLDGTAKGGVVIAIRDQIGVPIKYVGVGEQLGDLRPFCARDFAGALLNLEDESI